jgi:hypothetical protein
MQNNKNNQNESPLFNRLKMFDPENVNKELLHTGFRLNNNTPTNMEPVLPSNLDNKPLQELKRIYTDYAMWFEYVSNLLAVHVVTKKYLEAQLNITKAELTPESGSPQYKSQTVLKNDIYNTFYSKYVQEESLCSALEIRKEKLKTMMDVISRQITITIESAKISIKTLNEL